MVFHPGIRQRQLQRLHSLKDDAHRLDRVAEDDLLERFSLVARVTAFVDELHLLKDRRLSGFTSACTETLDSTTKRPNGEMSQSDVPRSSILISLRCCIRSLLSWFSISSFRALPSFSSVLIPQPILTVRQIKKKKIDRRYVVNRKRGYQE